LFTATADVKDAEGHTLVTAYPVLRPDGNWSLLVVNKDHDSAHEVQIAFQDAEANTEDTFIGPVTAISFGKTQYQWHPNRKKGYADPNNPPAKSTLQANPNTLFTLPPASLTVLRGKITEPKQ